jgi:hypothetical protein
LDNELDEKYNGEQFDMEHHELLSLYDANAARIARLENENTELKNNVLNLSNLITSLIDKFNSVIVNNGDDKEDGSNME